MHLTGHRISAILQLRWEDIRFEVEDGTPLGVIRWPGETDKTDWEHSGPDELGHSSGDRPRAPAAARDWADVPVFRSQPTARHPSARNGWRPRLRRAETLAGVPEAGRLALPRAPARLGHGAEASLPQRRGGGGRVEARRDVDAALYPGPTRPPFSRCSMKPPGEA